MNNDFFAGIEEMTHGTAAPLAMAVLCSLVRVAMHRWKGIFDYLADLCVCSFSSLCAHWILREYNFSPGVYAILLGMAALVGKDVLRGLLSSDVMKVLTDAVKDRALHEIANRGRPETNKPQKTEKKEKDND